MPKKNRYRMARLRNCESRVVPAKPLYRVFRTTISPACGCNSSTIAKSQVSSVSSFPFSSGPPRDIQDVADVLRDAGCAGNVYPSEIQHSTPASKRVLHVHHKHSGVRQVDLDGLRLAV